MLQSSTLTTPDHTFVPGTCSWTFPYSKGYSDWTDCEGKIPDFPLFVVQISELDSIYAYFPLAFQSASLHGNSTPHTHPPSTWTLAVTIALLNLWSFERLMVVWRQVTGCQLVAIHKPDPVLNSIYKSAELWLSL